MRDAIERMRLERRLALVFAAAVLALIAAVHLVHGAVAGEGSDRADSPAVVGAVR